MTTADGGSRPHGLRIDTYHLDANGVWVLESSAMSEQIRRDNAEDADVLEALDRMEKGSQREVVGTSVLVPFGGVPQAVQS